MGLCLPISSIAALLATLPTTASSASITCHWRGIAFLVGNSVLIDTLLSQRFFQSFRLASLRGTCQIGLQGTRAEGAATLRSEDASRSILRSHLNSNLDMIGAGEASRVICQPPLGSARDRF